MNDDTTNSNLRAVCPNCGASCELDEELDSILGPFRDDVEPAVPFSFCISQLKEVSDRQETMYDDIQREHRRLSELTDKIINVTQQLYDELQNENRMLRETAKSALERVKNVLEIVEQAKASAKSGYGGIRVASPIRPNFPYDRMQMV